jgi:CxxC motif-containing protein (DUF1111 family)
MPGLTVKEAKYFAAGQDQFQETQAVTGEEPGLGPRFNFNSCSGCHGFPAVGGSSPQVNPQLTVAPASQVSALTSTVPPIIGPNLPVREVRFKSDGGVHALFTIMGRSDTPSGCNIFQPNFAAKVAAGDVVFRIPTPVFGLGLIEAIAESTILANVHGGKPFGIGGYVNRNGNDGTITRFGWKAQNKSLAIFAGEAYNVEQGITNEFFPDERGEGGIPDSAACLAPANQDHTHYDQTQPQAVPSDVISFGNFMRFLAPPAPACVVGSTCSASINSGSAVFDSVGCANCHMRSMTTGSHSSPALSSALAKLFSDLLVHDMGNLGDGISQGLASAMGFRTAPLWGVGQRYYFLHDGRTSDLIVAIRAHADSGTGAGGDDPASEANIVIQRFNALSTADKQNLLNFLRSL